MKITITEALVELKRLSDRIAKAQTKPFVYLCENDRPPVGFTTVDAAKIDAIASRQSAEDLIKRYLTIKTKINEANSKAIVNIGGVPYTITQALTRKNNLSMEKALLNNMVAQYENAKKLLQQKIDALEKRLQDNITATFGSDAKNKAADIESLSKAFRENNKVEVLGLAELYDAIQKLDEDISNFEANVDVQLSIFNATTFIEI